jgi:queuosine precursor transporter
VNPKQHHPATHAHTRQYRYYDFLMAAYVTIVLCANLIGAAKKSTVHLPGIGQVTFLAGVLFFPLSYLFGDILTEVYGYARDRRVVWAGFVALAFASVMATVIVALPPTADGHDEQLAVARIFGQTPRIALASIIAFWCGSFVNSFVMAKMKLMTDGRALWSRAIGSTLCGELVDTALFYSIAFYGLWDPRLLGSVMLTQYVFKSGWEILMMPATYRIVSFLKRAEQEDYFDRDTDFTPFSLRA